MYVRLNVKCVLFWVTLTKITIRQKISVKFPNTKFHENPSGGCRFDERERTDRQTTQTQQFFSASERDEKLKKKRFGNCFCCRPQVKVQGFNRYAQQLQPLYVQIRHSCYSQIPQIRVILKEDGFMSKFGRRVVQPTINILSLLIHDYIRIKIQFSSSNTNPFS